MGLNDKIENAHTRDTQDNRELRDLIDNLQKQIDKKQYAAKYIAPLVAAQTWLDREMASNIRRWD